MDRRQILGAFAATPLVLQGHRAFAQTHAKAQFKQGVCPNVFGPNMAFEDGVKLAAACGAKGYDFLVEPTQWDIAKRHGITPTIIGAMREGKYVLRPQGAPPGWAATGMKEAQGAYLDGVLASIDAAAANGIPNVLLAAGSRTTVDYAVGADNTVEFINKVKGRAEEKGVTLCIEIVNSIGVQSSRNSLYDHSAWGWDVLKRVNSKSVKSLYDMWHVELMEGNAGENIRTNIQWIGHFHTGSIATGLPPGRYELWRNNEIDFHQLAQVIADTGFKGFVSHEWSPSPGSDVAEDLRKSIKLMAV
jgi:hydroxypyruvate isomerase